MHIGIDLDNTVLDATSAHLNVYNEVSGLSLTADDVDNFFLYKMYGWDSAKRDEVYSRYGHDIHWNSAPLPLAAEVIRELYERHKITFITARPPMFRDVTADWLKRYGFSYHDLIFTEDKLEVCIEANINVLIDDAPHYAEEFAKAGRPVILYAQPYNADVSHELVERAADWSTVKACLMRLEK